MRYKTLFRLLLKFLGVWLTIQGLAQLVFAIFHLIQLGRVDESNLIVNGAILSAFLLIIAGVYLFFGGRWIADKAIPGNRPYCYGCGYDLGNYVGERCPECGTPVSTDQMGS